MKKYLIAFDSNAHFYVRGLLFGEGLMGVPSIPVCVFDVTESKLVDREPFIAAYPAGQLEFEGSFLDMLIEFSRRSQTDPGAEMLVDRTAECAFGDEAASAKASVAEIASQFSGGPAWISRFADRFCGPPKTVSFGDEPEPDWTAEPTGEGVAYMLRRSFPSGVSRRGFKWPDSGYVAPPAADPHVLDGTDYAAYLFGFPEGRGNLDGAPRRGEYVLSAHDGPFRTEWLEEDWNPLNPFSYDDRYTWQVLTVLMDEIDNCGVPRAWVRYSGNFWGAMLNMAWRPEFVRNSLETYAAEFFPQIAQTGAWIEQKVRRAAEEANVGAR